jgi:tetratricopeptide (TPR) repeat protein
LSLKNQNRRALNEKVFNYVGGDINTVKGYFMNAEEYIERAKIKYKEKNFDGAIVDLTEASRLEPDNSSIYYLRGMVYRSKNEFDKAIADFTKAIQIEPDDGYYYFDRGLSYALKNNIAMTISDLEMAVKLEPQNEDFREALVEIKHQLNM